MCITEKYQAIYSTYLQVSDISSIEDVRDAVVDANVVQVQVFVRTSIFEVYHFHVFVMSATFRSGFRRPQRIQRYFITTLARWA